MANLYSGSCHCGRITVTVGYLTDTVTECNCSVCRRYQSLWAYYPRKEVTLDIQGGSAKPYVWNDRVIEFIHCDTCGCITHYEDVEKTPESRVGVNMRMFPPETWESLPVRVLDGADTWQVITIRNNR